MPHQSETEVQEAPEESFIWIHTERLKKLETNTSSNKRCSSKMDFFECMIFVSAPSSAFWAAKLLNLFYQQQGQFFPLSLLAYMPIISKVPQTPRNCDLPSVSHVLIHSSWWSQVSQLPRHESTLSGIRDLDNAVLFLLPSIYCFSIYWHTSTKHFQIKTKCQYCCLNEEKYKM